MSEAERIERLERELVELRQEVPKRRRPRTAAEEQLADPAGAYAVRGTRTPGEQCAAGDQPVPVGPGRLVCRDGSVVHSDFRRRWHRLPPAEPGHLEHELLAICNYWRARLEQARGHLDAFTRAVNHRPAELGRGQDVGPRFGWPRDPLCPTRFDPIYGEDPRDAVLAAGRLRAVVDEAERELSYWDTRLEELPRVAEARERERRVAEAERAARSRAAEADAWYQKQLQAALAGGPAGGPDGDGGDGDE